MIRRHRGPPRGASRRGRPTPRSRAVGGARGRAASAREDWQWIPRRARRAPRGHGTDAPSRSPRGTPGGAVHGEGQVDVPGCSCPDRRAMYPAIPGTVKHLPVLRRRSCPCEQLRAGGTEALVVTPRRAANSPVLDGPSPSCAMAPTY
ncbi:hypothetical protein QJS66_15420 [Kocuria rhizophila]|nr:hypothetical protein QJS66_15420 [Kocuria rhizophila]